MHGLRLQGDARLRALRVWGVVVDGSRRGQTSAGPLVEHVDGPANRRPGPTPRAGFDTAGGQPGHALPMVSTVRPGTTESGLPRVVPCLVR